MSFPNWNGFLSKPGGKRDPKPSIENLGTLQDGLILLKQIDPPKPGMVCRIRLLLNTTPEIRCVT